MQDRRFNANNNLMKQAIKAITLGRKSYLFCGNKEGAENKSIFFTFMACYREVNIEPYRWMEEVLSKPLPDMMEDELMRWLPSNSK